MGYGGFGSLEAGYQIIPSLNITSELMYSGFTSNRINTVYSYVNPSTTTAVSTTSSTGYIAAPYISDVMGMIGVEYQF